MAVSDDGVMHRMVMVMMRRWVATMMRRAMRMVMMTDVRMRMSRMMIMFDDDECDDCDEG